MKKFLPFFIFILLVYCSSSNADTRVEQDRCFACHDKSALVSVKSDESRGVREFLLSKGEGIVTTFNIFLNVESYTMRFPKRGRHTSFDLQDGETCYKCHPVIEYGVNHQVVKYISPESGFTNVDCSAGCHIWLDYTVESTGPYSKKYTGSINPYKLLNSPSKHRDIFSEGYRRDKDKSIVFREIQKGCLGCHSIIEKNHGSIPVCLDCHSLKGTGKQHHDKHIGLIYAKTNNMDTVCTFCHNWNNNQNSFPACYNCHLSGHNTNTEYLW